jgi:hypothetical protein
METDNSHRNTIPQQIEIRARLATKIKRISYPDESWPEIYLTIAGEIAGMCNHLRPLFGGIGELEFLRALESYSDVDLLEAVESADKGKLNPMFARALKL